MPPKQWSSCRARFLAHWLSLVGHGHADSSIGEESPALVASPDTGGNPGSERSSCLHRAGTAGQLIARALTTLAFIVIANAQTAGDAASLNDLSTRAKEADASLARIVELSQNAVVQTIVKANVAYAVVDQDGGPGNVELLQDVTRAYGVRFGQLLFSRARPPRTASEDLPADTKPGDDLYMFDLNTKSVKTVFIEYGVGTVAWHPRLNLIAATVMHDSGNGVLLYDFDNGATRNVRTNSIHPHFLEWGGAGDVLYFLEVDRGETGAATLVEYDLSNSQERPLDKLTDEEILKLAERRPPPQSRGPLSTERPLLRALQHDASQSAASVSVSTSFTWPTDPNNPSNGFYAPCADWPGDLEGCYWLSTGGWRDAQPFQKHLYTGYGYHLGADWNLESGDANLPVYAVC